MQQYVLVMVRVYRQMHATVQVDMSVLNVRYLYASVWQQQIQMYVAIQMVLVHLMMFVCATLAMQVNAAKIHSAME
jgi:hypothetical protein